ncbi:unnamed protein product [Clonostachys rosea f. rosea IK726]|uniref:Uncharacterized protein n=1 Tax=Clonostachys rosea f. rosea IK726 TaxID=1349383 RepID=A0ACA9TRA9_BIOOC|nr:unnamed protein product [Clonostachys rosea f. rosea IK726]
MKTAYICRACERKLAASPVAQVNRCLVKQPARWFTNNTAIPSSREDAGGWAQSHGERKRFDGADSGVFVASKRDKQSQRSQTGNRERGRLIDNSEVLKALQGSSISGPEIPNTNRHGATKSRPKRAPAQTRLPYRRTKSGAIFRRQDHKAIKEKKRMIREIQWAQIKKSIQNQPRSDFLRNRKAFVYWKKHFVRLHHWKSNPRRPAWFKTGAWLWNLKNLQDMQRAWEALDVHTREETWPGLMLSTLFSRPDQVHRVLYATLDPLPPSYAVQDAFSVIVTILSEKQSGDLLLHQRQTEISELVQKLLGLASDSYQPFTQASLGIFAKRSSNFHVKITYDALKAANVSLSHNTSLQYASKLAAYTDSDGDKYKKDSLSILLDAADNGLDLNSPKVAPSISKLLRCGHSKGRQDEFSPDAALHDLIERGFLPNTAHTNSLLGTLCRRGQVDEAVKLARLFIQNGIDLGTRFYHELFSAVRDGHRSEYFGEVLELMKSAGMKEEMVLDKILSAVYSFCANEYRAKKYSPVQEMQPFLHMLRLYEKKFPLGPLQRLIPESLPLLLMPKSEASDPKVSSVWDYERTVLAIAGKYVSDMSEKPLHPSMDTIGIMFKAYILSSWRQPYELLALYQHFKEMLESGDSFARALVSRQKSRVHNSFLYAMLSHQGLVRPALQVFGDMLHDELWEPNADGSTSASQRTPCHPEPSIYTYGVLLEGLSRRKEMTMMNQIMKIMEENHLKPNLVTMNTHIKSQAMAQNVSTVVTLMQSLEARGFEPDQFTLDAFGKLHDKHKKRALRMMQRIIDAKSKLLRQQEISQEPATP